MTAMAESCELAFRQVPGCSYRSNVRSGEHVTNQSWPGV
jgi:hypothetical protein